MENRKIDIFYDIIQYSLLEEMNITIIFTDIQQTSSSFEEDKLISDIARYKWSNAKIILNDRKLNNNN